MIVDRHDLIIGLLWALTIIATIVVAARFAVRHKIGGLFWDDWLMLGALVFQLIDMGFLSKSSSYGLGKHDHEMTFDQLVHAGKWAWLYMIPGTFVAVLARVSGAVFLIRLFGVRKWLKNYLIVFTTLQVIGGILVLFTNFLAISPVEAMWNPTIKIKKIRYSPDVASVTAYTTQSLFTVADLTYVLFPVIIIWNLHLSLDKRIGLMLLMCTSLITMAVSIMKAITLAHVSGVKEPAYSSSLSALWAGLEQTLVIIMASVPALSAVTKLNLGFRRLTSSLARSLGRSAGRSADRSGKDGKSRLSSTDSSAGIHSDLEKNSYNMSHNMSQHSREESRGHHVVPSSNLSKQTSPAQVMRTDEYTVSYTSYPQ